MLRAFTCLLLFVSASAALGQPPISENLAQRRAATLARGINLSGWFGGTGDLSAQHIEQHTTPADLKLIHDSGLQYVRLCIDPVQLTAGGFTSVASIAALHRIDHAVDQILAAGLAVQITVFPNTEYKQLLTTEQQVARFTDLWRMLARHFAPTDPERVFFELLNEPEVNDAYRWAGIQAAVVDAVRQVDTRHTLIATGAHYGSLPDLLQLHPLRNRNVIYTFHFYEPYPFTHQGASWGSPEWPLFHDIPYPATPESLASQLASIPDDSARYGLFLYGAANWNRQAILERLTFAQAWGKKYGVPVICNEFGAFRDTAPPDSRARFLLDVRTSLEQLNIGWAMWDYRGNFGMVTHQENQSVPDTQVFKALGLQPPS